MIGRSWEQLVRWVRERDAARGQPTPAAALKPPASSPEDSPAPQPAQLRLVE